MARRRFGADLTAVVWRTASVAGTDNLLQLAASQGGITAWTAQTGGTQVTDLTNPAGVALAGGVIVASSAGVLDFFGPATTPETVVLWLDAGTGTRQQIAASDLPAQVLANSAALAQVGDLDTRLDGLEARSPLQPLMIAYGTGAVPLRTTVTSDTTRPVIWYGTNAPTIAANGAGGTAVDGLDIWLKY